MTKGRGLLVILLLAQVLGSLVATLGAQAPRVYTSMDQAVQELSRKTAEFLPTGRPVVAVYYFTLGAEPAGISDWLINALSTRLAQDARNRYTVASRQALDRILAEQEFQVSDLVDRESAVQVGKATGARYIVTGFITLRGQGLYEINVQVLDTESALLTGGFMILVRPEASFANLMEPNRGSPLGGTLEALVRKDAVSQESSLKVVLADSFDGTRVEVQTSTAKSFGGELISDVQTRSSLVRDQGLRGSGALRFDMSARLVQPWSLPAWQEHYLFYQGQVRLGQKPQGFQGLALSLKSQGMSLLEVFLQQQGPDRQTRSWTIQLQVPEGQWQTLRIPFGLFSYQGMPAVPWLNQARISANAEGPGHLDPNLPLTVLFSVNHGENANIGWYPGTTTPSSSLLIDELGLYQELTPQAGRDGFVMVETFDTQPIQSNWTAKIDGLPYLVDYKNSDSGTLVPARGLSNMRVSLERTPGGEEGAGLRARVQADLGREFKAFVDGGHDIGLSLFGLVRGDWPRAQSVTLFAQSPLGQSAYLSITDPREWESWSQDFSMGDYWSRAEFTLGDLQGPRPFGEGLQGGEVLLLYVGVPISNSLLRDALASGKLDFEVGLDSVFVE